MPRVLFALLISAACLFAVDPRPKPSDYPAHAESPKVDIGAEYLVHSFSNGSQMYVTQQYLVVDTAVYPHGTLEVKRADFTLRLTIQGGRKQPDQTVVLRPETPEVVAYSITSAINAVMPEMRNPAGAPRQTGPMPGPSDQPASLEGGAAGPEAVTAVVARMALPEDKTHSGEAGYLYFPFGGPTKKIKGADLIYGVGDAALVVKLF